MSGGGGGGGGTARTMQKGKKQLFGTSNCCQQSWTIVNIYYGFFPSSLCFAGCTFAAAAVVRV